MAFTTWTMEDLTKLRDAIKKGVREVQYQDKKVRFHSLDEMLRLLQRVERELGVKKRTSRVYAEAGKGFC